MGASLVIAGGCSTLADVAPQGDLLQRVMINWNLGDEFILWYC